MKEQIKQIWELIENEFPEFSDKIGWGSMHSLCEDIAKLNKMEETSKNNETAQLGIADVVSSEAKLLPKGCGICNAEIRNDIGDGLCAECWSRQ